MERFSVSQLAQMTGYDRRTIEARLEGVEFVRGLKNAKTYSIRDVIDGYVDFERKELTRVKPGQSEEEKARVAALLADLKIRRETADTELVEIKLAKEKGRLVETDQIEAAWANQIIAMRAKLLSLPGRASVQTIGMGQKDVERAIDNMVREALEELSAEDMLDEPDDIDGE